MHYSKMMRYMEISRKTAAVSRAHEGCKFIMCCTLVKNGKVLSSRKNKPIDSKFIRIMREHPDVFTNITFSFHAEIGAVLYSRKEVMGAWAFINGISGKVKNRLKNTRPCENCLAFLKHHKIRAIVYYSDDKLTVQYL